MKTKSFLLAAVLAAVSIAGLAHGQTVPPAPVVQSQALNVELVLPTGFVATYAVASAPRYNYNPVTGATATIAVQFYKDAAAKADKKQPVAFRVYTATVAETAATFTATAVQASSNLVVGIRWLLTKPDFAGASISPQ
ncbi:MAG: hypothetical protein WC661_22210 [Opitutaceae bacterium]|jgi:hypothetical protein